MGHKQRNPVVQSFICAGVKVHKSSMFHNKAKLKEPSLSEFSENLICISIVKVKSLSRVRLFATLWTVAYQAPLSMGFSRQEYWSELPCPPPWDLPNPGIEPGSPALQADALPSEPPGKY